MAARGVPGDLQDCAVGREAALEDDEPAVRPVPGPGSFQGPDDLQPRRLLSPLGFLAQRPARDRQGVRVEEAAVEQPPCRGVSPCWKSSTAKRPTS